MPNNELLSERLDQLRRSIVNDPSKFGEGTVGGEVKKSHDPSLVNKDSQAIIAADAQVVDEGYRPVLHIIFTSVNNCRPRREITRDQLSEIKAQCRVCTVHLTGNICSETIGKDYPVRVKGDPYNESEKANQELRLETTNQFGDQIRSMTKCLQVYPTSQQAIAQQTALQEK